MHRILLLVTFFLLSLGLKAQLFSTDPAPYCADTIANADSAYIAGADFGGGFVIPGIASTPYINGSGLFYSVVKGVNAQVQLGVSNYPGQTIAIWVDANRDTLFTDNEKFYETVQVGAGAFLSINLNIPDSINTGITRARIRTAVSDSSITSCGDFATGSTIDFGLLINESAAPYCEPVSFAGCSDYDYIDSLALGSVSYTWPGIQSPGYQYINQTAALQAGQTYQLTMRNGAAYASAYNAWIDYNADHVFDSSERINPDLDLGVDSLVTFSFTVPANAVAGQTRFRIRGNADDASISFGPCDTVQYGIVVEFNVALSPVGISDDKPFAFGMYPNPSYGSVTINLQAMESLTNVDIKVTDVQGAVVVNHKATSALSVIELPARGIYQLSIFKDGRLLGTRKLVSLK